MKISPKQYAKILYEELKGKPESESKEIISNFINILLEKRDFDLEREFIKNFINFLSKQEDLNLDKDILSKFGKLYHDSLGSGEVEIISARPLSQEVKKMLQEKFITDKNLIIIEKIDPSIIGGFIIRYQDKLIDASLKHNINLLRKQINN